MNKENAIVEHRKLWNWIANTNKQLIDVSSACPVGKHDYFMHHGILNIPISECYLCQYSMLAANTDDVDSSSCSFCPIDWTNNGSSKRSKYCYDDTINKHGLYDDWLVAYYADDIKACVKIAEIIANLPEKISLNEE